MFHPRGNYKLNNPNRRVPRKLVCEIQKHAGVDIGLLTGVGVALFPLCQHHRALDYLILLGRHPRDILT